MDTVSSDNVDNEYSKNYYFYNESLSPVLMLTMDTVFNANVDNG
jgi:hypothetical protein